MASYTICFYSSSRTSINTYSGLVFLAWAYVLPDHGKLKGNRQLALSRRFLGFFPLSQRKSLRPDSQCVNVAWVWFKDSPQQKVDNYHTLDVYVVVSWCQCCATCACAEPCCFRCWLKCVPCCQTRCAGIWLPQWLLFLKLFLSPFGRFGFVVLNGVFVRCATILNLAHPFCLFCI